MTSKGHLRDTDDGDFNAGHSPQPPQEPPVNERIAKLEANQDHIIRGMDRLHDDLGGLRTETNSLRSFIQEDGRATRWSIIGGLLAATALVFALIQYGTQQSQATLERIGAYTESIRQSGNQQQQAQPIVIQVPTAPPAQASIVTPPAPERPATAPVTTAPKK